MSVLSTPAVGARAEELARTIVREDVLSIASYSVPSAQGLVKLDMMENPHALPATVRRELVQRAASVPLHRYPTPEAMAALRAHLARSIGLGEGLELLLGNGSDELIRIILQACARPGATVLSPGPSFSMYSLLSRLEHCRYVEVPLREDFSLDMPAMLGALARERPAVTFLAWPNNPTGNLFAPAEVDALIEAAPGLVVVDEAYLPFARRTYLPQLARRPNLLVLRTLSKSGLAGMRLGYLCGAPAWIAQFDKVRPPFNVNSLTLELVDLALEHEEIFEAQALRVRNDRDDLVAQLRRLAGIEVFDSDANFVLVRVDDARVVFEKLLRRRILVKDVSTHHPLLRGCLRLTVGTERENELLVAALAAEP